MGKSTIAHHFLDGVVQRGDALVLRGRAYEREVVPYKAVDGIIDALSRHLLALEESGDPLALPEDAWALARLFPVLRRVPSVAQLVNPKTVDLQGVRARAFTALRALLVSLVRRAPLVLFIDDVQWGDVDSAMLVADLVRPPDAPALLLVMTFRSGEEPPSSFLAELSQRWPEGAEAHEVLVGPLPIEEAEHLARSLLDMSDALGEMTAKAVARESRGSPFLIEELARSNRGLSPTSEAKLNVLTLEQMVGERLERLPEGARGALEMLALDGRPMRVSLLAQASGLTPIDEVVTLLAARRFARTGQRDGEDIVESIHDRIRATVAAQIPEGRRRAFHARLADVLEEASSGDAEAIAVHWLGAGEGARAAAWASTAAEQATRKFAFDRAARLLELALANTPEAKTSPEVRQLHARLANALQFAGRYEASAREYLAAADGAPTDQVIALHRAVAEQLLMGRRMDEGAELLHRVLYALDMRAPRSAFAAVFWLLLHRAWLAMRGLGFSTRAPEEVQPEDRVRIDALFAVAMGFSIVDVVLGACMQTRQLIEALRKGDELQIVRAASIEAGHMAATGTTEGARERALVALARTLAERDAQPQWVVYSAGARGIGLWNRGRWAEARPLLDRAISLSLQGFTGISSIRLFDVYASHHLGQFRECGRKLRRLEAEAADRRELFTTVNLHTGASIWVLLVEDRSELARRQTCDAIAQWSNSRFSLQHWQDVVWQAEIDLYEGHGEEAYARIRRSQRALGRSMLLQAGYIRSITRYSLGRAAIASLATRSEQGRARIAEARRLAKRIAREPDAWTGALASLLRALAANAEGDRAGAARALRDGIARAEATSSFLYAMPARHRLGELVGGDEGRVLVAEAEGAMATEGVRDAKRWVACQLPGDWAPRGSS